VLWIALLCLPPTLIGAWIGARVYVGVSSLAATDLTVGTRVTYETIVGTQFALSVRVT